MNCRSGPKWASIGLAQDALVGVKQSSTLFFFAQAWIFGTKEDLLGGNQDRFGQVLTDAISELPAEASVWEALPTGVAAVLSLHDSREKALERFRLLHNTASLRAGWIEKRLRFQEGLLPLIETRMDAATDNKGAKARAVIATAFACLDAASMTWVANDGKSDIMDLYDECPAAVRG